jgi:ABC-type uncharacterized transport system ATPase subunit
MFAADYYGVQPDMIAFGKGVGGGFPLAGVLADESLESFGPGDDALTFGQFPVALAAALATAPQVLLVDELAAGAGADELDTITHAIGRVRERGVALLVVEHNLGLVRRIADRVLVLATGSVVAEGSVAEVAASGVVQEAYLGTARL